jgi:hypothetical protein
MTIGYHNYRRRRLWCRYHNLRVWGRALPAVHDIVDVGHLLEVFDSLKREAGQAPGIDHWRYADIGRSEAGDCLRAVSSAILEGRYRPHPCREQEIPKRGGSRTLRIKTIMDRVVEAALDRALKNFWERRFLANSHGFRPRRSPWTMLASLSVAMASHHRLVLVNDDVQTAFDKVNLEILLEHHRRFINNEELMNLIATIIRGNERERGCGIHQGGAYSPTALNFYLHIAHDLVLDRDHFLYWWRYADNLVYLCQDMSEGRQVRQRCLALMRAVDLTFKGIDEQQWLTDLNAGQSSELLGYVLSCKQGQVNFNIASSEWEELTLNLMEAHTTENPQEHVQTLIAGKLNWWSPALRSQEHQQVLDRIRIISAQNGFRELPLKRFQHVLMSSRKRWQRCLQDTWRAFHAR